MIKSIQASWGDGEHEFRLRYGELDDLEKASGDEVQIIFGKLLEGRVKLRVVRDIIRLGLIGGGMPSADALKLVTRYFGETTIQAETWIAARILGVAVAGRDIGEMQDVEEGESTAARPATEPAQAGSTSPQSAETPASSA